MKGRGREWEPVARGGEQWAESKGPGARGREQGAGSLELGAKKRD